MIHQASSAEEENTNKEEKSGKPNSISTAMFCK